MRAVEYVEATCSAAFVAHLLGRDHEWRGVVHATENGVVWASVDVSPTTDTRRAVFPVDSFGVRGDSRRRSCQGVQLNALDVPGSRHALSVVVERARRMALVSA